jgi:hypothetical protein
VSDDVTKVAVDTDLTITGKVAQFGRGAIADVSAKLMTQFAQNVEQMLVEAEEAGDEPEASAAEAPVLAVPDAPGQPVVRKIDSPEPEAVDLLEVAGTPILKRAAPVVGVLLVLLILRRILGGD